MSREFDDATAAFGDAMRRYQAAVDDFDRAVAAELGVNPTDARCLEVLMFDHEGGATPATLGKELALTSGSVTTMIDRLVRAGLAERRGHPSDQRTVLVVATEQAVERSMRLHHGVIERGTRLLAAFPVPQLRTMTRFLDALTEMQREEESRVRSLTPASRR